MIGKLRGRVDDLKPTGLIVDAGGVGYSVSIPFSTYEAISGNAEVSLYIYTIHKEDQFKLYGFHEERGRELFSLLLGVSGVGPSMALALLSKMSPEELADVVKNDDSSHLMKVPGIGKSKAEKLIFELKRKLKKLAELAPGAESSIGRSSSSDAVEALMSLGFDEKKSTSIVNEIRSEAPESSLEDIIKGALRRL